MPHNTKTIRINGQRTILCFFTITILLDLTIVAFDLLTTFTALEAKIPSPFTDFFNMALEANLLSWFSSMQLFFAGLLCFILCGLSRHEGTIFSALGWGVAALMFTFMSLDDVASIHERTGLTLKMIYTGEISAHSSLLNAIITFPSYYWQAFFLPIYAAFAFLLLVMGKNVMVFKHALRTIVFGLVCYVAAVGLDFIDGFGGGFEALNLGNPFVRDNIVHLSQVSEEFLELLGTSLIIIALLGENLHRTDDYRLRSTMP